MQHCLTVYKGDRETKMKSYYKLVEWCDHTLVIMYNIDWIIPKLQSPKGKLWNIASTITLAAVGIFSKIVIGNVFCNGNDPYPSLLECSSLSNLFFHCPSPLQPSSIWNRSCVIFLPDLVEDCSNFSHNQKLGSNQYYNYSLICINKNLCKICMVIHCWLHKWNFFGINLMNIRIPPLLFFSNLHWSNTKINFSPSIKFKNLSIKFEEFTLIQSYFSIHF